MVTNAPVIWFSDISWKPLLIWINVLMYAYKVNTESKLCTRETMRGYKAAGFGGQNMKPQSVTFYLHQ